MEPLAGLKTPRTRPPVGGTWFFLGTFGRKGILAVPLLTKVWWLPLRRRSLTLARTTECFEGLSFLKKLDCFWCNHEGLRVEVLLNLY